MENPDSILIEVQNKIREWGRGRIFFPQDFSCFENPDCVRQALCKLTEDKMIARLARGIYCYPRVIGEYAIQTVYPDEESIAQAISLRDNVRIIPYGDQCAYRLGLTTIRLSSLKYLTDGSPRVINLAKGRKIYFNHTSEVKMFAFSNETMQMISMSLRALGKEYLYEDLEKRRKMRQIVHSVPEEDFNRDISIPPAWVGEILLELWKD